MKKKIFLLILLAVFSFHCKKKTLTVPVRATCLVRNMDEQPIAGKTLRLISGFNLAFANIDSGKVEQTAVSGSDGKVIFNYTWTPSDPKSPTYYIVTDDDAVYKVVHNMKIDVPRNSETFAAIVESGVILMDKFHTLHVRIKASSNNVLLYSLSIGNVIGTEATIIRPFYPKAVFISDTHQVDTLIKTQIYSKSPCGYEATMLYTNNSTKGLIGGIIFNDLSRDSTLLIAF